MKQLIMAAGLAVMLTACGTSEKKTVEGENPFFAEYTTPFGVPPFDQIKFEHYKPALLQGMEEGRKEIARRRDRRHHLEQRRADVREYDCRFG